MFRNHPKMFARKKVKRTAPSNNPYEADDQIRLCNWMDDNNVLYYAIPNEGNRSIGAANKAKAMGLQPGVPDLCIPIARHGLHGMYMELKRTRGGVVSEQQKIWINALREQGYYVIVTRGYFEALKAVCKYMDIALPS